MTKTTDRRWIERAQKVAEAETANFVQLIRLGGLDPRRHLRYADWSGIDMAGCDLRGFDFTGARLHGCKFEGALIDRARFDQAELNNVDRYPARDANLRAARDWQNFIENWRSAPIRSGHNHHDQHLPEGAIFQDAPFAPELVVISRGRFPLDSPRDDDKAQLHEATIPERLAIGRFPVTFEQWEFAVKDGGLRRYRSEDDWGERTPRPIINVSWDDAQAYVDWLSRKTRHHYRLLKEAEWEYCYRAGMEMRAAFFNNQSSPRKRQALRRIPNACGLYYMHSDVMEWFADRRRKTYRRRPLELKSRIKEKGGLHIVRGRSSFELNSKDRLPYIGHLSITIDNQNSRTHFRPARTLA